METIDRNAKECYNKRDRIYSIRSKKQRFLRVKDMIEIKNLQKGYEDKREVLKNVNLTIQDGTIFGLVGANGVGKSTLLRLLSGILEEDGGHVRVDGEEVYENEEVKSRIFFLSDEPYHMVNTTAKDLSTFYSAFYAFDESIFTDYLNRFGINPKTPIRNFSKGVRRQVFLVLALAVAPKYLFLDEAFDGLDSLARMIFKQGLKELVEKKNSIVVISSHSLRELEEMCDCYGILQEGELICSSDLEGDLYQLHKFQMAFDRQVLESDFSFSCVSFEQSGKVVRLIAKGDAQFLQTEIEKTNPLFVEEITVDLEELFIGEARFRGYLK